MLSEHKRRSVESLVDLLDEKVFEEHIETPSPAWREMEASLGDKMYADILFHLTRMEFSPTMAKSHWRGILTLRDGMSRVLKRPLGLRTAVCEYFISHEPMFDEPVVVESLLLARNEQNALLDELTQLHNRRFFNRELHKEAERARRAAAPFSLLMIDVDHFKNYNDRYGHLAGDEALRGVADILRGNVRLVDHVARFGGEEFAIILPGADPEEAKTVAERQRFAVATHSFCSRQLTISIGSATYPLDATDEWELVTAADRALYRAKALGRNRVCCCAEDKRGHPRFPVRLPVRCRVDNGDIEDLGGVTVNISLSGMLLESRQPISVGKRVEAELIPASNGAGKDPGPRLPARTVRLLHDEQRNGTFYMGMAFETPNTVRHMLRDVLSPSQTCH